ncbi:MAG: hypothetical protein GC182_17980 [Rhodopseudomonas sp.]|nr:hypothetical protein [Rhodopseudomonas sp.]
MTTGIRTQIALLFYTTFNVVVFTAAVYATSLFPPLTSNADFWIAAIMATSLVFSAPVAWCLGACLPHEWHDKLLAKRSPLSHAPSREF